MKEVKDTSRSQIGPSGRGTIAATDPLFTSYKDLNAIIIKNTKNQMQSGIAKTFGYKVVFISQDDLDVKNNSSVMQWVNAKSNLNQISLEFESIDAATRYLDSKCFRYSVVTEELQGGEIAKKKIIRKKNYGDNFM